jgi:dephospho-CoA kinase
MLVFGLTGGIASGKSTVAKRIRARGIPVVDADLLAREVVARGTSGFDAVVRAFGEGVVGRDGELDRKALGTLVFGDPVARKKLNAIVHPLIFAKSAERMQELAAEGHAVACYEAALLVENGMSEAFRPLVVVAAPLPVQIERVVARDGLSRQEALARVEAQLSLAEKVAMADYVIDNSGTEHELELRTDGVIDAIVESPPTSPAS